MAIPQILRIAKRRTRHAVQTAAHRVVVRGVLQHVLAAPARRDASGPGANRTPPHFLIARYHYDSSNPDSGPSIEQYLLNDTLKASQLGTADTFYWESTPTGFPRADAALLARCREVRPDAIILSSYEPGYPAHPSVESIRVLRKTWNIPVVAIWWDTNWHGFWASLKSVLPFIDVHVVTDNPLLTFFDDERRRLYGDRFLALWEPVDPVSYNNPGRPRDLDVAFLGQVGGYRSGRVQHVQNLMDHNVPVFCSMFNKGEQPSHEKYLEVLKRAKIGLNFSQSVDAHALKWRVFETMSCGALLMESENPQTRRYFTESRDYVSFESPADLLDKVRYFLAHEDERAQIAASGERRVVELFNHIKFWQPIVDKLGVDRRFR